MREIAHLADRIFNRLFGHRLISLQAVTVSACFSLASLGLAGLYLVYSPTVPRNPDYSGYDWFELPISDALVLFVWFCCFLVLGLIPPINPKFSIPVLLLVICGGYLYLWIWHYRGFLEPEYLYTFSFYSLGIVLGILCDFAFIIITRKLLRASYTMNTLPKIIGVTLLNYLMAIALVKGIWWMSDILYSRIAGNPKQPTWVYVLNDTFSFTARSNFITFLLAFLSLILVLVVLLHRIAWPLVNRPIYALQKLGAAKRRKPLAFAGLGLILISGVGEHSWVKFLLGENSWVKLLLDALSGS